MPPPAKISDDNWQEKGKNSDDCSMYYGEYMKMHSKFENCVGWESGPYRSCQSQGYTQLAVQKPGFLNILRHLSEILRLGDLERLEVDMLKWN